jgi:hypothetical protein
MATQSRICSSEGAYKQEETGTNKTSADPRREKNPKEAPPEGATPAPNPAKRQRTEQEANQGNGLPSELKNVLQHHKGTERPIASEPCPPPETETLGRRSSSRTPPPAEQLIKVMLVKIKDVTQHDVEGKIFCLEALFPVREEIERPLMGFKATSNPDIMYLHEAMKEPDRGEFVKAMEKEVRDQMDNGNFSIIPKIQVPKGEKILPTVWQMKIKKYKARLNINGSRREKRIHYWDTYAPVASWNSIDYYWQ